MTDFNMGTLEQRFVGGSRHSIRCGAARRIVSAHPCRQCSPWTNHRSICTPQLQRHLHRLAAGFRKARSFPKSPPTVCRSALRASNSSRIPATGHFIAQGAYTMNAMGTRHAQISSACPRGPRQGISQRSRRWFVRAMGSTGMAMGNMEMRRARTKHAAD